MARCNCAGGGSQCSCSVIEGDGIRVTGSGDAANPYMITALGQPITGQVAVEDTASLNLTLSGLGMVGEPYIISGEVVPGAQQPITGQLTVSDTASLNLTLAGEGTVGDPYVVSGAVLSAPATGQLTVQDTASLDLTLTGAGEVGDPYVVSGTVLSAPAGDLGDLGDVDTTGATLGDSLVFDGTEWVAHNPITVSATAPGSPIIGDIWFDIS